MWYLKKILPLNSSGIWTLMKRRRISTCTDFRMKCINFLGSLQQFWQGSQSLISAKILTPVTSFKRLKWPQTKCTQFPIAFLGTIFHALSHGAMWSILFAVLSLKSLEMEVSDWLLKNVSQWWFLKLTLRTKSHQSERVLKPVSENGVRTCVNFCLRSLGPLERCDFLY